MKLIHITDTHFVAPGQHLYGLDPKARLEAAVRDINAHHRDAELVIITGDLAHWGEVAAYEALRDTLAKLIPPVLPILGNHDDRHAFRSVFSDVPLDASGFVQGVIKTEFGRLLFLDTNQPGTHVGWYCEARQAWLREQLSGSDHTPVFMFMHHPPFDVGFAAMDRPGLVQRDEVTKIITPRRHLIRHIFFGHVHRPIAGSWLEIPFSTLRATNHQVWLDWSADTSNVPGSHEPPAYAIVLIDRERVAIHTHDYLDASLKFNLGAQTPGDRDYALAFTPVEQPERAAS